MARSVLLKDSFLARNFLRGSCRSLRFINGNSSGSRYEQSEDESLDLSNFIELYPDAPVRKLPRKIRPTKMPGPSKESTAVIQMLRRTQYEPEKLEQILKNDVSRLVCSDLNYVLSTLMRARDVELALKVFTVIRKESWYKPQVTLYEHLIRSYCSAEGGAKPMKTTHELMETAESEGLKVTQAMCEDPIACCIRQRDFNTCMDIYEKMHASGCIKDYEYYKHLVKKFKEAGYESVAKKIFEDYSKVGNCELSEKERKRVIFVDY